MSQTAELYLTQLFRRVCTTALVGVLGGAIAAGAMEYSPPDIKKKEEVFIEANNLDYDHENGVVVATGNVEILKGGTVLFADKIQYDQKNDIVTAEGNVSSVGPSGETVFTDKTVVHGDLRSGVIDYFRAKLADGSLVAAAQAKRINENKMELTKAVYSPCPVCREDDDPQWQLKADKVIIDDEEQRIKYEDAYLDVYGTTVLYAPYFSHPTPNADPKSGLLTPKVRSDGNLGATVQVPYYWHIRPDMDLTFEPIITTKEGLVAAAEFRHLTEYGEYKIYASGTRPRGFTELAADEENDKEWRGHIKGKGLFDITESWDFGFDGEAASDDTYLRRYNFSSKDMLTSKAYLERIDDRDYSNIQTVYFQGLLEQDDQDAIPLALPYIKNHFESYQNFFDLSGSRVWADASGFAVNRDIGSDSQRGSISTGVIVPFVTPLGHVLEAAASVRADQYHISDAIDKKNESRAIPEISLGWRYPLANILSSGAKMSLEPMVKIIGTSNNDYNEDIPNEDSQDVEFSDLNFMHNNKFRGLDRVESGTRTFYGLRGGYYDQDLDISYVLGQNYQISKIKNLPTNTGLNENFSDIVGRMQTSIFDRYDLSYKFRLDKDSLKPRRHEVDLDVDYKPVKFNLSYFYLDYDFTNQTDNREEVSGTAQFYVTDEWSLLAGGTRNIAEDKAINANVGLLYEGECTNILTSVEREFVSDRDAKSGTSVVVLIGLKNLGEF